MTLKESKIISLLLVGLMIFSAFAVINFAAAPASGTGILTVTIASDINPADAYQTIYFNATASFPAGDGTYGFYYKVLGSGGSMTMAQNTTSSTWETTFQGADTYLVKVVAVQTSDVASGWAEMNETVDPQLTVSASVSHTTIDKGMSVTFSSTVSGGASPYTYQWYLNSSAVSGATLSTWTTTTLPTGSQTIYVKVTDSNSYMVQSNTVTETVNPPLSVSISSSENPIDYGMSVTFNSVVSGGTPPYSYQWSLNGANVSGATGSSWTTTTLPIGTDSIRLWVTDAAGDPEPGKPNTAIPMVITTLAVGGQGVTWVYTDNLFNVSVADLGYLHISTSYSTFKNFTYTWFLNGTKIVGANKYYYETYESHPGTYDFSVRIIPTGTPYKGEWIGQFSVDVVAANVPRDSVDIIESGLPIGSSWSGVLIPSQYNSTYPYGTTFTQIGTSGYQTVYQNTSQLIISPPNGTWVFKIDLFNGGPPGYARGSYIPNISEGNITLPAQTANGSVIIRIKFSPIGNSSGSTSPMITGSNITSTNSSVGNGNNSIGVNLSQNKTPTLATNSTISLRNDTGPVYLIRTFPIFKKAPAIVNFVLFIPIVFGLVIRRASRKKQRDKEVNR